MTETADELSTPLGQKPERRKRRFRLPFSAMQALAVLLGLFLVAFLSIALFTDNPLGGEPVAQIALRKPAATDEKPAQAASSHPAEPAAKAESRPSATGENKTVTIIDGSSGKRQDVVIGGDAAAAGKSDTEAAAPAAVMAGIAGALLAQTTETVSLETLGFQRSADVLVILILGGAGRLYGGIVGAIIYMVARDQFSGINPQYWYFWIGALLVAVVIFLPNGILGGLARLVPSRWRWA